MEYIDTREFIAIVNILLFVGNLWCLSRLRSNIKKDLDSHTALMVHALKKARQGGEFVRNTKESTEQKG